MADANHKSQPVVSERFVTVQASRRFQSSWHNPRICALTDRFIRG